jgi:hypothetical protein
LLRRWDTHHEARPEVVIGLSSALVDRLEPGDSRFVHIDGGHQRAEVAHDLALARRVAMAGALVVIDDWRTAHTPGVAAAFWAEVTAGTLHPVLLSAAKAYAVLEGDAPIAKALRRAVLDDPLLLADEHQIDDDLVLSLRPGTQLRRRAWRGAPYRLLHRVKRAARLGATVRLSR